jgi:hypothetical protein
LVAWKTFYLIFKNAIEIKEFDMLGFSSFAESPFGGLGLTGAVIVVTGSGVTVSSGSVTIISDATFTVTGSGVTVSSGTVTFTISGTVSPDGSGVTVSTGAADVNVITWNAIDPGASQTWTNIDPL